MGSNTTQMIKVNSKVSIQNLEWIGMTTFTHPPIMVVEGLYYLSVSGRKNVKETADEVKPDSANCVWYDSENRLQTELIDLDILTEA